MFLNRILMVSAGSPHHVQSDAEIQDEGELKMSSKSEIAIGACRRLHAGDLKIRDGGQATATPERSFKRR
jgi:hypothetical protein